MKLCESKMICFLVILAVISPTGQEGVLDVRHRRASFWPYSARVLLRTPAGLIFGAIEGQLNCQISLEKDSALSQESVLMVAVSVVLPLAAGEL